MKPNPVNSLPSAVATVLLGLLLLAANALNARAQGVVDPLVVLRTGTGGPLITASQSFFVPASANPQTLQIAVGFSTDEIVAPDTFFDSVTLTLEDELASLAAIFFTIDISGTYWAPTPGGVFIDPDAIVRSAIPFPTLTPVHASQVAYSLTLPVPASMTGKQLNLFLDLFNNQDAAGSLAWMSPVTIVPEPASFAMALLGAGWLVWRRRK